MLTNVQVHNNLDLVSLHWVSNGCFSIKSLYNFLLDGGLRDPHNNYIWKLKISIKAKNFIWLVLKRKVLLADNLFKRGLIGERLCVLCANEVETCHHLFSRCLYFRYMLFCLLDLTFFYMWANIKIYNYIIRYLI